MRQDFILQIRIKRVHVDGPVLLIRGMIPMFGKEGFTLAGAFISRGGGGGGYERTNTVLPLVL